MNDDLTLNIYGQPFWHHPARIIGNRAALELLITTISNALKDGKAETPNTDESCIFASDGEGYQIEVELMPGSPYLLTNAGIEPDPVWWLPKNCPQYILNIPNNSVENRGE